ncbi:MAG: hypothetical protein P8L85_08355 [Rubripirellula sp.]|nr:hypothetical protein [Rubripirellula sp.]
MENYHVHRKFNTAMGMGVWAPHLLLYEPMWTCSELYGAAKEVAVGHDLAFVYDQHGKAIGHQYPRKFLSSMQDRSANVLDWEEASQRSNQKSQANYSRDGGVCSGELSTAE